MTEPTTQARRAFRGRPLWADEAQIGAQVSKCPSRQELNMDKNKYLIRLSESKQTDFGKVDFDQQSEEQRVFTAIWTMEGDVNNGGFPQWLENDNGETAGYAPTGLRRIGAAKCADIVERSLRTTCGGSLPADAATLAVQVSAMSDKTRGKLEALNPEFYAYPDNLTDLLFEFVRGHPKVFGPIKE